MGNKPRGSGNYKKPFADFRIKSHFQKKCGENPVNIKWKFFCSFKKFLLQILSELNEFTKKPQGFSNLQKPHGPRINGIKPVTKAGNPLPAFCEIINKFFDTKWLIFFEIFHCCLNCATVIFPKAQNPGCYCRLQRTSTGVNISGSYHRRRLQAVINGDYQHRIQHLFGIFVWHLAFENKVDSPYKRGLTAKLNQVITINTNSPILMCGYR